MLASPIFKKIKKIAATPSKGMLEAPNHMIFKRQAEVCLPEGCVSKLVVGVLQRRFDALLQAGTLRLNTTYLVAGLIIFVQRLGKQAVDKKRGAFAPRFPAPDGGSLPPTLPASHQ
jgi:hypothetical protein